MRNPPSTSKAANRSGRRKDPSRWLTIYFPDPELRVRLQRQAERDGRSMGETVRTIISRVLR